MKKLFIRKSLFAVPLVVLFLTFLYPQTGRADCPDEWWCPVDPPNPEVVNNPYDPYSYSPGFDLIVCYDLPCVASLGLSSSGLTAPHVTINTLPGPKGEIGCTTGTTAALQGPAICAASTDGVLGDVAECTVSIKLPSVSCSLDANNLATYSKFQSDKQDPFTVYTSDSKVTIKNTTTGLAGWPCPSKDATGHCTADFYFPIGTVYCSSSSCVTKIYPATGDGISFDSLSAMQVMKGAQIANFLAERGCKGPAVAVGDPPSQIACSDKNIILTGGGQASVAVQCPEGSFAGNRTNISTKEGTNGFDLFGNSVCPLNGIDQSSVKLNGVPNEGCQPQGENRLRCFFEEAAVYEASDCAPPPPTKTIELVATGNINVPQGGDTVTVPFFTNPGQEVTCK